MFGLSEVDNAFLVGLLMALAYSGAVISFVTASTKQPFARYITSVASIALTGVILILIAYLTQKGIL
ncbi:hypothetical protein SPLA10_PHROGS00106 [Salmonella phage SPLA10]|nr:hypothetical protein SPLA10_PHROGS00106 [Salmonella phage SPLA10]